jgi:hypothetical protein
MCVLFRFQKDLPSNNEILMVAQKVAVNLLKKNSSERSVKIDNINQTEFHVKDILFDNISSDVAAANEYEGVHIRLERYHYGLYVIGGDLVIHLSSDLTVMGVSPSTILGISVTNSSITTALEHRQCESINDMTNTTANSSSTHQLVIYGRRRLSKPLIAWDVTKQVIAKDGTAMVVHYIMEVNCSRVIDHFSETKTIISPGLPSFEDLLLSSNEDSIPPIPLKENLCYFNEAAQGIGNALYNGRVKLSTSFVDGLYYQLKDPLRQCHTTVNDHSSFIGPAMEEYTLFNIWGWSDNYTAAADVHYGYAASYDYFLNMFGRQGIYDSNKSGMVAQSRLNLGRSWNNTSWYKGQMTFGIGDGIIFNPFTSLEIVAHVFTHGLIDATANLIYSEESGALHQATCDILSVLIDFHSKDRSFYAPNYFIGEKLFRHQPGSFFRSMIQPSDDAFLYGGLQSSFDCYCQEKLHAGDITDGHYFLSGVANHFFYLLAEGTVLGIPSRTCNPLDCRVATRTNQTLVGIGQKKAGWIWYRALTAYFTSDTNFSEAQVATIKAAKDLFGTVEVKAVKDAWSAVKVFPVDKITSQSTHPPQRQSSDHSSINMPPNESVKVRKRWRGGLL